MFVKVSNHKKFKIDRDWSRIAGKRLYAIIDWSEMLQKI